MRCRFCGSTSLHDDTQDKRFSTGKAVAGTIVFGLPGAAAGLIGKKVKGYRCSACGSFMETPMDAFTEVSIDTAIRNAESGRDRSSYDYYKGQYPNIQANLPVQGSAQVTPANFEIPLQIAQPSPDSEETIKRSYRYGLWQSDCPVYVEGIILKSTPTGDKLSLIAWNSSVKTIRSAYFQAKVLDDTGDVVSEVPFVYQGISVRPGMDGKLPENKEFDLKTDLAYKVELICDKVAFEGDEVWRNDTGKLPFALPVPSTIDATNFPRFKYITTKYIQAKGHNTTGVFMPMKEDGYWLCDCGQPVLIGHTCPRCGDTWEDLEVAFSQKHLQELQQVAVKERAAKRAEELAAFTETARANKEKADLDFKEATYADAVRLQLDGSVESLRSAAKAFELIPGWRDADERTATCKRLADEKEEAERITEEKRREERRIAEETQRRKEKKILAIVIPMIIVAVIAGVIIVRAVDARKYAAAHDFSAASVGDIRLFGSYEQDNDSSNGKEEIEWIVLAKQDNKALILSKYALDCKPFYDGETSRWWSDSSVRDWLHTVFVPEAFSKEDLKKIVVSKISTEANPQYPKLGNGGTSEDWIFLLSIQEVEIYFSSNDERQCEATTYAVKRGVSTSKGHCTRWLRSAGDFKQYVAYSATSWGISYMGAAYVYGNGEISYSGEKVQEDSIGVRPAMWISF